MDVRLISLNNDLVSIAHKIHACEWDEDNELGEYTAESLVNYLKVESNLFVACYIGSDIAGIASAKIQQKPYQKQAWLYVDEVDVGVKFRQQGVGKSMMKALLKEAKRKECGEVWLATELDNNAAIALYRSLNPKDESKILGYTFDTN